MISIIIDIVLKTEIIVLQIVNNMLYIYIRDILHAFIG